MERKLSFTGERFVPGIDDNKLMVEHLQRYLSIKKLVVNKDVLDAACGEGYGSEIISEIANKVVGLDIDNEAILCAKEKYSSRKNLEFVQGSIEKLPLDDNSVDVVVSFETIEHVPEITQQKYIKEIKRVLRDDGILIMSTPNKKVYSDQYNYHNEYHIKEFYKEEFIDFIKQEFINIELYNQSFEVVSIIDRDNESQCSEYQNCSQLYKKKDVGKYYIAIASNTNISRKNISSAYLTTPGEYDKLIKRVLTLQDEEEERNNHIKELDDHIQVLGDRIRELECENREKDNLISNIKQEFEKQISDLNVKVREYKEQIIELCNQNVDSTDKANQHNSSIQEYKTQNELLKKEISNKEGHIELLLEQERAYMNLLNSKGVKVLKVWWNFKEKLFPHSSKRRLIAKMIKKFIKHPIYMLKKCTPSRIKRTIHYIKTEEPQVVENRLEHATLNAGVVVEKMKLKLLPVKDNIRCVKDVDKLIIPVTASPVVSIIIPVYNQINYTYNCIKSIIDNTNNVEYEIIIADDCSTDLTQNIDKIVENIVVVKTKENLRFLRNCNNAAKYAKGKYIMFLNNDTQVLPNWLDSLVKLIERDSTIGMVGSKLLYPDGSLQEAGGIIWGDGHAWNYGNAQSPNLPQFNYVKEVDYISGAAIMLSAKLWNEIGGFDEYFSPAYCEDSDLAFEVRKRGYKVVYQPASMVVHFEGKSNGTDVTTGVKKYQVVNAEKLKKKWKDELKLQSQSEDDLYHARERSHSKKTILVIDHYVPQFDRDAGSRTTWQYLKLFIKQGYNVKFIGDNFYQDYEYTPQLEQMGIEVLYGPWYAQNYKNWIIENQKNIDYVYLNRPHIAEKYIDFLKKETSIKCIYYGHDLHFLRIMREYEVNGNEDLLNESNDWKEKELSIMRKADMNYYPSYVEEEEIHKIDNSISVKAITAYVYEEFRERINLDFTHREGIMFVGGFGHPPNEDAVLWFAEKVYPLIKDKHNIPFYIVGSKVTDKIRKLEGNGIVIKGFVSEEELQKLYNTVKVVVVPLRYGAGMKGKVVEAIYYGTPMVSTTVGVEGIEDAEKLIEVADDALEFAEKVVDLYNDSDKLVQTVKNYQEYIKLNNSIDAAWDIIKNDFS